MVTDVWKSHTDRKHQIVAQRAKKINFLVCSTMYSVSPPSSKPQSILTTASSSGT